MTQWQDPVTVTLSPFRTISEANTSQREHWAAKHKRAKGQRSTVYRWLRHLLPALPPPFPLRVTLTRIAPRLLDSGNLEPSVKHVQDGVADYLCGAYGQGEDRQPGLTWQYAQRRGQPREYGVTITFTTMCEAQSL